MRDKDPTGLQTPEQPAESLQNTRVTARIIRDDDGTRRRVYEAHGREFGSRAALKEALGVSA